MKKLLFFGLLILAAILLYYLSFSGKQCGGIAANINSCPVGYECRSNLRYPDALGNCRFSLVFTLIELRNKYFK